MKEELIAYVLKHAFEGLSDTDPWSVERSILEFFDQYQPERSKREDSSKDEMRCSEHCGNTMRDK